MLCTLALRAVRPTVLFETIYEQAKLEPGMDDLGLERIHHLDH